MRIFLNVRRRRYGQVLHGSARTAEAVRRAIQHPQESLRTLAQRHGFHPKTIARWRKRSSVAGRLTGAQIDCPFASTESSGRCLSPAHAAAARPSRTRSIPGSPTTACASRRPAIARSAAAEIKLALARGELFRAHTFEFACAKAYIGHRLAKPKHPWTNGQVERMNRTLKEATVKRFDDENLRRHLKDFVAASNFARRLKTLKGLTPYKYIRSLWTKEPQPFTPNPHYLSAGPYS